MPLPKYELKPGYAETYRSGKGHDDPRQMLQEIHEGVLELGPKCELLGADNPNRLPPTIGFVLFILEEAEGGIQVEGLPKQVERSWEFFMTLPQIRDSIHLLPPATRAMFMAGMNGKNGGQGRSKLAALLHAGVSPETIEARLSDPMIKFIYAQINELEEQEEKAGQENRELERKGESRPRQPFGFLRAHPALSQFLYQQQAATLKCLVHNLELGKHLGDASVG